MDSQHLSPFHRQPMSDRLALLVQEHFLRPLDADALRDGSQILAPREADRMIENAIGVFGLPLGLGLHFQINDRDYVVPMAVEEPSVVAAVSSAAKRVRRGGGFQTQSDAPMAIGQIVIEQLTDPVAARKALLARKQDLINLANSLHPKLIARGGGARDIEAAIPETGNGMDDSLVIHLLVDTRDAMGANLVNSMCEGIANLAETISGGRVLLRVISNLCDRSLVRARAVIPVAALSGNGFRGEEVRDRIISAGRFAAIDTHRAATHNKGIMNGIDAVAIATGNDWRAIEAGVHAYAARNGRYTSLTRWDTDKDGHLVGRIELPLNVGTVGGSLQSNPAVKIALQLLKIGSSRELAGVMAAVGLAQNLAALRALVTDGIQKGHMRLHARSVAHAAGADADQAEEVVQRLIESGTIKIWKAREIMASLENDTPRASDGPPAPKPAKSNRLAMASAAGKIILLGEHAVLYGSRALAAPLKLAVEARVVQSKPGVRLVVPSWGIDSAWEPSTLHHDSILRAIDTILLHLGITRPGIRIELFPQVPRAMGLGSSAAAAVAIIRGLSAYYRLDLDNAVVNRIAHEAERIIHGQSSGIDNSVACYSTPLLFQAGQATPITPIEMPGKLPLVVGISRTTSLTAPMVARVRKAWRQDKARYDALFRKIDGQVGEALEAIRHNDLDHLGHLMNANQRLLEALKVSTPELQAMIRTARDHGARGAKLTGGGGGGAMLALCPDDPASVAEALRAQGWQALNLTINAQTLPAKSRSPKGAPDENHQRLVQVDDRDRVTGYCTREQCHAGEGLRHRAFSIFIFDRRGRVLLQKRSGEKTLWPLFWSNSCCSHPRAGESTVAAAHRRLTEELGIAVPLTYLFKFAYQARYDASGSENELCSVFIGRSDQTIATDPREVDAWRYVTLAELDAELAEAPERFTPWLKLEWERLRHHPLVLSYQPKTSPAA